jgi:hypothetical protein
MNWCVFYFYHRLYYSLSVITVCFYVFYVWCCHCQFVCFEYTVYELRRFEKKLNQVQNIQRPGILKYQCWKLTIVVCQRRGVFTDLVKMFQKPKLLFLVCRLVRYSCIVMTLVMVVFCVHIISNICGLLCITILFNFNIIQHLFSLCFQTVPMLLENAGAS